MRDELRLFIVVGKAALITIVGAFAPLALMPIFGALESKMVVTHGEDDILGATLVLLPIATALWISVRWMFRTLQTYFTRREARAMATAFAGFSPVWLGITPAWRRGLCG